MTSGGEIIGAKSESESDPTCKLHFKGLSIRVNSNKNIKLFVLYLQRKKPHNPIQYIKYIRLNPQRQVSDLLTPQNHLNPFTFKTFKFSCLQLY